MDNNKTSLTIPIILIGLVIIGIFLYTRSTNTMSPDTNAVETETETGTLTTAEDSDNNTYKNDEFNFSIQYYDGWRLVENGNSLTNGTVQLFNYPADKYVGGEMVGKGDHKIEMVVMDNSEKLSLEEFVKANTLNGMGATSEHEYFKNVLGNAEAYTDNIKNDPSYKSYYVELENDKVFVLTVSPNTENEGVDEILGSFKLN